jgi:hypothetical protein
MFYHGQLTQCKQHYECLGGFPEHVWAKFAIWWATGGHLRGFGSRICSMDSDIRLVRACLCIPE